MNCLYCIDLMDTLIHGPDRRSILRWGTQRNLLSAFQLSLLCCGFPFAAFASDENEHNTLREWLLLQKTDCIETLVSSSRYLLTHPVTDISKRIALTKEFVCFFVEHSHVDEDAVRWIHSLRSKADVKLLSNLFSVYKPLISRHSLSDLFSDILLSCELAVRKPSEMFFIRAEDREYLNKYFVGDNWHSDILPALKRGYICYYVSPENDFFDYVFSGRLADILCRVSDHSVAFRREYIEQASWYLQSLLPVKQLDIKKDFYLQDGSIRLKSLKNVHLLKRFDMLHEKSSV